MRATNFFRSHSDSHPNSLIVLLAGLVFLSFPCRAQLPELKTPPVTPASQDGTAVIGQNKDISGTYSSKRGAIIEISGNEFNYIDPQFGNPRCCNDTLARCAFKWVNADFIELNSTPPRILALKGFKADKFTDAAINDSIKVSFLFPRENRNLKITVFDNDSFKPFYFIYSDSNRELMLPKFRVQAEFKLVYSDSNRELMLPENVASIDLCIAPEDIVIHTADGLFYGTSELVLLLGFK